LDIGRIKKTTISIFYSCLKTTQYLHVDPIISPTLGILNTQPLLPNELTKSGSMIDKGKTTHTPQGDHKKEIHH